MIGDMAAHIYHDVSSVYNPICLVIMLTVVMVIVVTLMIVMTGLYISGLC
tara:strand:- start:37 stop:186 length:150 start_codon:yes stop_codon:yes gene_type:complete